MFALAGREEEEGDWNFKISVDYDGAGRWWTGFDMNKRKRTCFDELATN